MIKKKKHPKFPRVVAWINLQRKKFGYPLIKSIPKSTNKFSTKHCNIALALGNPAVIVGITGYYLNGKYIHFPRHVYQFHINLLKNKYPWLE